MTADQNTPPDGHLGGHTDDQPDHTTHTDTHTDPDDESTGRDGGTDVTPGEIQYTDSVEENLTRHLMALRMDLATRAERRGVLDIAFHEVDSPVGRLLLAATAKGVVRVAFEREGFDDVLETLAEKISPRVLSSPRRLEPVARELDQYFDGQLREFTVPKDYSLSEGFRLAVQQHLTDIGYGHTASYKEVADLVGNPKAVRAVGTACATNPLPVVVPCHRVVRSDGTPGGYVGGLDAKQTLLTLENEMVSGCP